MSVLAQYVLINGQVLNSLTSYFLLNFEDKAAEGKPLVVTVTDKQESLSSAQRRLYFMWMGQLAAHWGTDKDYEHVEAKKQFLIKIYYRDDADFAEMCDAIKTLKKEMGETAQYKAIADGVIRETSITKATVKQMTEYLNCIFACAMGRGVKLNVPEDLKWAAEGGWV